MKMYSVVLRHLSPIQKGIQSAHSIVEFGLEYPDEFREWGRSHKTMVVLQVNTVQQLLELSDKLFEEGIKCIDFFEPDLMIMTSTSFILPKHVQLDYIAELSLAY